MVEPKRQLTDDPVVLRMIELIEKRSLNEKLLIEKLGMARGTFTSWKYGRVKSYQAHINEIAEILDVSPNYLLRGVDDEVDVETLSDSEIELIKAYRTVGNDGRRHIDEMVAYITEACKGRRKG